MTPKQLLQAAKKLLKKVNWLKGCFQDYDTERNVVGCCMVGAMDAVSGYGEECQDSYNKARKILWDVCGGSVTNYNDNVATCKEDVLQTFDKAIKRCKE